MAKIPSSDANLRSLVDGFVNRVVTAIETDAANRARQMVMTALSGSSLPRRRGRPPKYATPYTTFSPAPASTAGSRPAKKRPKQLCPMPGCTNLAAPVFGMVCAEHKGVPKSVIKKHREARKAARAGGEGKGSTRRGKPGPKPGKKASAKKRAKKRAKKAAQKATRKSSNKAPTRAAKRVAKKAAKSSKRAGKRVVKKSAPARVTESAAASPAEKPATAA